MSTIQRDNNVNGAGADNHLHLKGSEGEEGLPPRVHFYDYLIVLARNRYKIILTVALGTLAAAVYVMVMPQVYTSSAILLPPDKEERVSLGSFLQGSSGFDFKGLSENSSAEVFVKILQSRTLADSLVNRLNLLKKFDLDSSGRQLAIMMVQSGFDVSADRQGMINISFNAGTGYLPNDREKKEAGEFAQTIVTNAVDLLDVLNRQKSVTRARRTREYLGRMKVLKRAERDSIQMSLLQFQQRNRAVALDKQIEASIGGLVDIQTQIQKKELELNSALNELNPNAAQVTSIRSELEALRRQRVSMEEGRVGGDALGLQLSKVPELARQLATLKLDLEVATQVYTFLETQYNQQQVQEARDLPTVSVLDRAEPPMYRSAPRRTIMVGVTFAVLLFSSVLFVFLYEAIRRHWGLNDSSKAQELRNVFRRRRKRALESID
jgi:uncharacterized protein involved in exopolysaccharide biosynthesis